MKKGIDAGSRSTHRSLLIRIRSDSPAREVAWQEFHDRYAPMIVAFARRMGARDAEVDDLVQDVMLAFYGIASTFEYDPNKGTFRAFLRKVTFRLLCNKRGREAKFRGVPID